MKLTVDRVSSGLGGARPAAVPCRLTEVCVKEMAARRVDRGEGLFRGKGSGRYCAVTEGSAALSLCRRQPSSALNDMHRTGILTHMRTTLNIDDALLGRATELSGLREKTAVVRAGLEALVARESARRLAALGGTDRGMRPIPRRRPQARRPR